MPRRQNADQEKGRDAFQVMAPTRPLIVLHPKYIDEIKSHPHLDFDGATQKVRVAPTTLEFWETNKNSELFFGSYPRLRAVPCEWSI